jgi:hypothetical protein
MQAPALDVRQPDVRGHKVASKPLGVAPQTSLSKNAREVVQVGDVEDWWIGRR